ncbi:MAG: hypothetical protein O3C01_07610 [Bacteroidetes bacterium]|nr:hypothetical protein [Bacteroidota bacterium]
MKKILFAFIFIFWSLNSSAHIGHYNNLKKIEIEILRNGEVIGYNYYFFKNDKDKTIVTNQFKFEVKLLGATLFELKGYGEETYLKDNLVSYKSKTIQNKKNKFVNLNYNKKTNKYDIKGSSYIGEASLENVIGNWWSHKILQASSQISPISGSIKEQIVTFIGKEKINLYGKDYEAQRFKLSSKDMLLPEDERLNFNIWFDKKSSMILKVSYSNAGNWEYRLKFFE